MIALQHMGTAPFRELVSEARLKVPDRRRYSVIVAISSADLHDNHLWPLLSREPVGDWSELIRTPLVAYARGWVRVEAPRWRTRRKAKAFTDVVYEDMSRLHKPHRFRLMST
jgi:hypothetical protein